MTSIDNTKRTSISKPYSPRSPLWLYSLLASDYWDWQLTPQKSATKEIGIRKVLGANVSSIVTLLTKDFILLVIIAILVATPVAWFSMSRWLESFCLPG